MKFSVCIAIAAMLLFVQPLAPAKETTASVKLAVNADSICVGDNLFLKATLQNISSANIRVRRHIARTVLIRRVGKKDWKFIASDFAIRDHEARSGFITLEPEKTYCDYDMLFMDEDREFVFPHVADMELKVRAVVDGAEVYSDLVKVKVVTRPGDEGRDELALLKDNASIICELNSFKNAAQSAKRGASFFSKISTECNVYRCGTQMIMLDDFRNSGILLGESMTALRAARFVRNRFDPITADYAAFQLASTAVDRGDLKTAERILDILQEKSVPKYVIEEEIRIKRSK